MYSTMLEYIWEEMVLIGQERLFIFSIQFFDYGSFKMGMNF